MGQNPRHCRRHPRTQQSVFLKNFSPKKSAVLERELESQVSSSAYNRVAEKVSLSRTHINYQSTQIKDKHTDDY